MGNRWDPDDWLAKARLLVQAKGGREGVGVAVKDGGGGDFRDVCGWLASGAGISYGSNTALVACNASSVEMTLPLALEAGLVPEFTSTTLFSGLSSSLQIGE